MSLSHITKFLILILLLSLPLGADAKKKEKNMLYLKLKYGTVVIQMFPKIAPKHVERVKQLVKEEFYDGIIFHRVIDNFMAQTGDPTGTGTGGSSYGGVPAEFTWNESFTRGTVGAARSQNPNSADSQFFICLGDATFLDGDYTIWGRVVKGMEYVDKIQKGEPPSSPDKIISMRLAE